MNAHRVKTTIPKNKTVTLDELPFPVGQSVVIIVRPRPSSDQNRYPLRGTPIGYDFPTEPVAETDWDAVS